MDCCQQVSLASEDASEPGDSEVDAAGGMKTVEDSYHHQPPIPVTFTFTTNTLHHHYNKKFYLYVSADDFDEDDNCWVALGASDDVVLDSHNTGGASV